MFGNPYPQYYYTPQIPQVQPLLSQPYQTYNQTYQQNQQPNQISQPTQPNVTLPWQWKAVSSYQDVTMENVPMDGTPILCMLQNEATFYIVRMVDGRKMINGFQFTPIEVANTVEPEQTVESRLDKVEKSISMLVGNINKLLEVNGNEPNNDNAEEVKRTTIKQ